MTSVENGDTVMMEFRVPESVSADRVGRGKTANLKSVSKTSECCSMLKQRSAGRGLDLYCLQTCVQLSYLKIENMNMDYKKQTDPQMS